MYEYVCVKELSNWSEEVLNKYADQGWRLKAAIGAEDGFKTQLIFERRRLSFTRLSNELLAKVQKRS